MPPRRTVARPVRDANPPQYPLPQTPIPSTSSQPMFQPQPGWPQQAAAFYPHMGYAPWQQPHMQPAWNGNPYYYYQQQQQQQQQAAWQAQQSVAPVPATAYPQHPLPQVPPTVPQSSASTSNSAQSAAPSQPRWRPPPSECQPCRKRFSSVVQLIAHKAQHLKCTEGQCTFEGDDKALSLHKQDRHLIFPPGKHQPKARQQQQQQQPKKRPRGDHDQSDDPQEDEDEEAAWAKRFANAPQIEGTSIKLDSPEAIKAWIEERKKKWPTAKRVEEKAAQQASRPASAQQSNNPRGRRGKQDQAHRAQYSQPLNLPVQSSAPGGNNNNNSNNNNSRHNSAAATTKRLRVELPSKPSSDTLATATSTTGVPDAVGNTGQQTPTFEATVASPTSDQEDGEDAGPSVESSARRDAPPANGNEEPTALDRPDANTNTARQKQQNERATHPRNRVDGSSAGGPDVEPDSDSSSSLSSTSASSSVSSSSGEDSDSETAAQANKHKLGNGKSRAPSHQAPENTAPDKLPGPHDERIRRAPPAHRQFVSAPRTGLLSKLLEHDVAHEMSDLVQVAEFLVRNQFLKGVELKPGDADHELIQEVQQQPE